MAGYNVTDPGNCTCGSNQNVVRKIGGNFEILRRVPLRNNQANAFLNDEFVRFYKFK